MWVAVGQGVEGGVKDLRVGGWGTFVVGGRGVHCAKASCN